MAIDLNSVRTIVIVMMENRSFDNLLGYLSLPSSNWNVEGLGRIADWEDKFSSLYQGNKFPPFLLTDPYDAIDADPPHERDPIATQMGAPANGVFPMNGFVTNYANALGAKPIGPGSQSPVMGYFSADQAPVTQFLAENFAICDHWFSALPAGTQPNRLMAMSGLTMIDVNQVPLPDQELVYDWLTSKGVRWRVYHQGMPFFAMMTRWLPDILKEQHFRPFAQFFDDVQNEPTGELPQVIFLEPTYTDAPHIGIGYDDHAPSAIRGGQEFLLECYRGLTRVPDVWKNAVMILTYDEHGGFFDHVSPPAWRTDPPAGALWSRPFETLGVRVPGFVISPFVTAREVYPGILDHTSILKFLGQKFGNGSYSALVDARPVGSVADVLNAPNAQRAAPAVPSLVPYLSRQPAHAGYLPGRQPETRIQQAFRDSLNNIRNHPDRKPGQYDDLLQAFP